MGQDTLFVGLDVHKEKIAVALAEGGREGEVRFAGTIINKHDAVQRLVAKHAKRHERVKFCYEAGPCGYAIYRQITKLGHECTVVAPSLIPTRPGDRVKTDRRDAVTLARLHRADELTAVWVPDEAHEAMRDLVRARTAAMENLRRARQQLQGFLLRHNRIFTGGHNWTKRHRRWLAALQFDHPAHQIVLQESVDAIDDAHARLIRLEGQIAELLPQWSMAPVVEAIQAMRGVSFISAVTIVAETGDLRRFDRPRQLMSYLGLVPSEYSSGSRTLRGGITKAGSRHARRVLIEGAWTYRTNARVGPFHQARLEGLPKTVRQIAWKARRSRARWAPSSGPSPATSNLSNSRDAIAFRGPQPRRTRSKISPDSRRASLGAELSREPSGVLSSRLCRCPQEDRGSPKTD